MNDLALRSRLDIISICTGGGGLDLGVELAIPCARNVCVVEREAFAVAQLVAAMEAGHLAPAPVWSDVRTFDGKPWRGLVDGVIGGIPCQPHSLAGRKRGQLDGRDLWSDARRIIATARPWFVLIENVSGMLSAGADEIAGAERVWRDLRKLGFAVEGGLFTAAEVGASHERERVFILGMADARGERGQAGFSAPSRRERAAVAQYHRDAVADAELERSEGGPFDDRDRASGWFHAEQGDRRYAGLRGGATLVHAERPEWRSDADGGHQPDRHDEGWDQAASRTGEPGSIFPPGPSDLSRWRDTLERAPELEPAFRRVADGLASRLDIARVDRLRLLGNGVVPLEAAYAVRTLVARLARRGSAGATELARMMVEE